MIGDFDTNPPQFPGSPGCPGGMASKMLHVSTAGGRQFDVELEEGETIATLKKKLFELIREAQQWDMVTSWWFQVV